MRLYSEQQMPWRLREGAWIAFETAGVRFLAVVDSCSMLSASDRVLVSVCGASDARFAARVPKRLWLCGVSRRMARREIRLAGPTQGAALAGALLRHAGEIRVAA